MSTGVLTADNFLKYAITFKMKDVGQVRRYLLPIKYLYATFVHMYKYIFKLQKSYTAVLIGMSKFNIGIVIFQRISSANTHNIRHNNIRIPITFLSYWYNTSCLSEYKV